MKQLLHASGNFVIVGLKDRAFVGPLDNEYIYELDCPPSTSAGKESYGADVNPLEIQSVAIHRGETNGDLFCAVSRYNKALSIYKIDSNCFVTIRDQDLTSHQKIGPITTHKTNKRTGSLCFARIPNMPGANQIDNGKLIIIAGDLAGDAVAYSLDERPEKEEAIASQPVDLVKMSESEIEHGDDDKTTQSRHLLLGHTASMLTSVRVVQDGSETRILTSDRDEKVRVSAFPHAFLIHGYLLGHEAFVSSMDVATNKGVTRCVTCGGDGTIRIWDYLTCEQLYVGRPCGEVVASLTDSPEKQKEKMETVENAEKSKRLDESSSEADDDGMLVPSRIALSPNGNTAVLIFDESRRLDIISIIDDDGKISTSSSTVECASTALSVAMPDDETVVVLTTDPYFLETFQLDGKKTDQVTSTEHALCSSLRKLGTSFNIQMPASVLEKDKSGQLKMQKLSEMRGPANMMPWNNAERVEVAKARNRRSVKKRRQKIVQERREDKRSRKNSSEP